MRIKQYNFLQKTNYFNINNSRNYKIIKKYILYIIYYL